MPCQRLNSLPWTQRTILGGNLGTITNADPRIKNSLSRPENFFSKPQYFLLYYFRAQGCGTETHALKEISFLGNVFELRRDGPPYPLTITEQTEVGYSLHRMTTFSLAIPEYPPKFKHKEKYLFLFQTQTKPKGLRPRSSRHRSLYPFCL